MKGVKKCFLFCGTLMVVSLVSCLGLCSANTSALKHSISAMPLYNLTYFLPNNSMFSGPPLTFAIHQSGLNLDLSQTHSPIYFETQANSNFSSCSFELGNVLTDGHLQYNNSQLSSSFGTFYDSSKSGFPFTFCNQLRPFGSGSQLSFSFSSIPAYYQKLYRPLDPYSYDYASYFYHDTQTIDGVVYNSHGLMFDDILDNRFPASLDNTHQITSPSQLDIPIGIIKDIQGSDFIPIRQGSVLDFDYEIYITEPVSYDLSPSENASVRLISHWIVDDVNYTFSSSTISCPVSASYDGYGVRFSWHCQFVSPSDIYDNLISFAFQVTPGSGFDSIWSVTFDNSSNYSGNISFFTDGIYVVTDYDDTPGNSIGGSSSGGDLSHAPGSVSFEQDLTPDYNASLDSLFNFNFINPFAPLFNLFTDNSSCASIPTIAGMLHSEETTYCPWFPSEVRSVLTPVLGIASMMLIFGFAVRWLSSSSGNMFEDQTTHKWGNTQFKQGGK